MRIQVSVEAQQFRRENVEGKFGCHEMTVESSFFAMTGQSLANSTSAGLAAFSASQARRCGRRMAASFKRVSKNTTKE